MYFRKQYNNEIMARFELKLPKMGESVAEATITSWLKEVGDTIELDEAIVEIATDKVDSEVPSEVEGTLVEILFHKNDVVEVGATIAVIETEGGDAVASSETKIDVPKEVVEVEKTIEKAVESISTPITKTSESGKFYSPLVRNIAQTEGISMEELESISGNGKDGRVTKDDILSYIENRSSAPQKKVEQPASTPVKTQTTKEVSKATPVSVNGEDEVIEMSRMGKLIAKHMVDSAQTSAHVQSFIEIDVTNIVKWRNKVKDAFLNREGEKLTFTPILMHAVASTIKKFPLINIAVDGDNIIKKKEY